MRQSYAEVTASQRRVLAQKEQCVTTATEWYKRAQLALKANNEGLAKEALLRRQTQLEEAAALQGQMDGLTGNIDKLYEGMQVLEKSILEAKSKKEQMVARARTAQSTQRVNDMLGGITGKTSMDAFKRMEDKVEALEAAADVSAEMTTGKALPGTATGTVESQFLALEAQSSVEDELSRLKGILKPSSNESAYLDATSSSQSGVDEWEILKRDAGL